VLTAFGVSAGVLATGPVRTSYALSGDVVRGVFPILNHFRIAAMRLAIWRVYVVSLGSTGLALQDNAVALVAPERTDELDLPLIDL
jgi:hypothetical protein